MSLLRIWSSALVARSTSTTVLEDLGSIPTQIGIFFKLSSPFFLTMDCKVYYYNVIATCIIRCLLSRINLFINFQIRASNAHDLSLRRPLGVPLPEGSEPRHRATTHQGKALQFP